MFHPPHIPIRTLALLLVAIVLASVPPLHAATIEGRVFGDASGDPLPGVNVRVTGTHHGAASDLDGRYVIRGLPVGSHTLEITHLGYTPVELSVTLADGDVTVVRDVRLVADAVELDRVVYTATRTMQLLKDVPLQTEVVTAAEMRETGAITAAEALETEIGIEVRDDFSGQGIMLQGVDPEQVLILVDGNRVIGRVNGSIDLNQLSTQGIKQIEVVKGALSTLYGSEAIGGVVNIITDDPVQPLTVTAELTGGSYVPSGGGQESTFPAQLYSPALEVQGRSGDLRFQAGVRYDESELFDSDPSTLHTDGAEAARRLSSHGKLSYDITESVNATVFSRYFNEDKDWIEDAFLTTVSVQFDDEETNRRFDLGGELRIEPDWAEIYSIKVYRSDNHHDWGKFNRVGTRRQIDQSLSDETYNELATQVTRNLGPAHRVTVGADVYRWLIETKTIFGEYRDEVSADLTAWAVYLQDEWLALPRLTLVPGIRYESHEVYGENISPKLSAMVELRDDLRLRGSVGQGYRAPSSKELYFTFNHATAGYIVFGNPDLEPETSTSAMLSMEHTYKDRSTSRISVFHNDLRNLIDFDSLDVTQEFYVGRYRYENIISAYTQGVEIEEQLRFALIADWLGIDYDQARYGTWNLGLAYSFLNTYNRETGEELLRRPNHSARINLSWRKSGWNARLWGRYTSSALYQTIDATAEQTSDERTNPYTLWNVSAGYRFGNGLDTRLTLENAFDTTHPRYGPYRGRIVSMTWRYTWMP